MTQLNCKLSRLQVTQEEVSYQRIIEKVYCVAHYANRTTWRGWLGEDTTTVLQTARARKKSRTCESSAASYLTAELRENERACSFSCSCTSGITAHSCERFSQIHSNINAIKNTTWIEKDVLVTFQYFSAYHGAAKSPRHVMVECAMWRVCVRSRREGVEG